jgi:hypothetical protein
MPEMDPKHHQMSAMDPKHHEVLWRSLKSPTDVHTQGCYQKDPHEHVLDRHL